MEDLERHPHGAFGIMKTIDESEDGKTAVELKDV